MFRTILILMLGLAAAAAAPRAWKSADGSRSFQGNFVSRDGRQVTIRSADGRIFMLDVEKLHADDRSWLDLNHPAGPETNDEPKPDDSAVFDTLNFGDDRETVLEKLKQSTVVEMTMGDAFLGRLGLNGAFRTKHRVGDLHGTLFFEWSPAGLMREVSIHTEALPQDSYSGRLSATWREFITLMTTLYGQPLQAIAFPKSEDLEDGAFLASHLWRLEGGGSALLGSAREGNGYLVVVRFTQQTIEPLRIP